MYVRGIFFTELWHPPHSDIIFDLQTTTSYSVFYSALCKQGKISRGIIFYDTQYMPFIYVWSTHLCITFELSSCIHSIDTEGCQKFEKITPCLRPLTLWPKINRHRQTVKHHNCVKLQVIRFREFSFYRKNVQEYESNYAQVTVRVTVMGQG